MKTYWTAGVYALAMILIAVGREMGVVDASTATTMFAIIPALAVISIARPSCRLRARG